MLLFGCVLNNNNINNNIFHTLKQLLNEQIKISHQNWIQYCILLFVPSYYIYFWLLLLIEKELRDTYSPTLRTTFEYNLGTRSRFKPHKNTT